MERIESIMDELNELTGLSAVKSELNDLIKTQIIRKKQKEAGLNVDDFYPMNFVFTGNPGTGKSTVARILGEIYHELGALKKGHLVEVSSSDLIAQYVGQTEIKTREAILPAVDGVLLIDEVYTLVNSYFGPEALEQLFIMYEEYRGRMIMILTGNVQEMKSFLDSHPGIKARFTQYIEFEDYTPDELYEIFNQLVSHADMLMTPSFSDAVKYQIEQIYQHRKENFGNAREMKNLFEHVLRKQRLRLAKTNCSDEQIKTFEVDDL